MTPDRHGLRFEPWEKSFLRRMALDLYPKHGRVPYEELAKQLGRSPDTVKNRLRMMGIEISSGKFLMADNERDEAYMQRIRAKGI